MDKEDINRQVSDINNQINKYQTEKSTIKEENKKNEDRLDDIYKILDGYNRVNGYSEDYNIKIAILSDNIDNGIECTGKIDNKSILVNKKESLPTDDTKLSSAINELNTEKNELQQKISDNQNKYEALTTKISNLRSKRWDLWGKLI